MATVFIYVIILGILWGGDGGPIKSESLDKRAFCVFVFVFFTISHETVAFLSHTATIHQRSV